MHIFNPRTALNLLLDEILVPRAKWAIAPRHVSIALTNLCDLHCAYCYAPKHRAQLNVDLLTNWLWELDAADCMGVGFGGGEPTLHPGFVDICRYASEKTGLAVSFTTHGNRLDDSTLERLAGNVHFVRFSMDGYGSTYETLRGRSFPGLLSRMKATRKIAPIGINVVVNHSTIHDLHKIASVAHEIGATEILLLPEQPIQGSSGIDSKTDADLKAWVMGYTGPVPLRVSEAGAKDLPTCDPMPQEKGLKAYAHIDADGMLKRNSYRNSGVKIGSSGVLKALTELHCMNEDSL